MLSILKSFIYPTVDTYAYKASKDIIISKMTGIFNNSKGLFSGNDIRGKFITQDTFTFRRASVFFTGGIIYSPKLVGHISEQETGIEIKTTIKTRYIFYFWFIVAIFFGIGYFYTYLQTGLESFLMSSVLMLLLGPFLTIKISIFLKELMRDRYLQYIDKELKKHTTETNSAQKA